ncbi:holliday junction DNA helicase RuvB [Dehalogenimonas formicexedens]|uniref:Holliday junction DNA helicase RuvB n=3 Tax=Dehalococcoidaceae TaxID=1202464 RepID=A0A1P8F9X6_9CHLR|nr:MULTISPECIES: ATP-binding protein [Dehalogenimonas]APV45264.1 holliday junction DNA helicase RuvB [Dehalogenimonas formicexedens]KTB49077.1 ATPase family associated with various cellular activities (AAA) [Dehalogenimonas alkenigignens]
MKDESVLEQLSEIARFEASVDMDKNYRIGWGWRQVRIWPATLSKLFKEGYLENVFRSNSHTGYRLSELGKHLLSAENAPPQARQGPKLAAPDSLFADIIGHDGVKELLRASLLAEKPVHVLLTGPPALAKTLFLWDIEKAGGEKAIWLVGSATSKAGLWDLVAGREPSILLIDEIDKMNAADTAALLTMMEGGRLIRAKRGRELNINNPLWVVAASNRCEKLSPELRSRFAIRMLNPYGRAEYLAVVKGVLVRSEGLSSELATEVADRLDGLTQNVRDAIRVARLAPQLGVEKAIKLLLGGASNED